jgi:hypothetical protein
MYQESRTTSASGSNTRRRAPGSIAIGAFALACALAPQPGWASTKSPAIRLKRVNQALEAIAGHERSTRTLMGTGEIAAGTLYTFTGIGLVYGSVKYGRNSNLGPTGLFPVDLGSAYIDAYSKGPGVALGVGTGGMLTFMGVSLFGSGISDLKHGLEVERYYYDEFGRIPQRTEDEIARKADIGEKKLTAYADAARRSRQFYGWSNLVVGVLMLGAATAHPDQPAGFFLGGGAGVYGFVTLLQESQAEEEYADYVAWKSDTPRESSKSNDAIQLAAVPTPRSLALGLSFRF